MNQVRALSKEDQDEAEPFHLSSNEFLVKNEEEGGSFLAQNNIQAALACIISQEKKEEELSQKPNFKLSSEQEKYIEEKIMEILERKKRTLEE